MNLGSLPASPSSPPFQENGTPEILEEKPSVHRDSDLDRYASKRKAIFQHLHCWSVKLKG